MNQKLNSAVFAVWLLGAPGFVPTWADKANAAKTLSSVRTDFDTDPTSQGWTHPASAKPELEGRWIKDGETRDGYISVGEGNWECPLVRVRPISYYRLRFKSRTKSNGYWAAIFFDKDGKEIQTDVYDTLFPSDDWSDQEFVFRTHSLATHVKLHFQAIDAPIDVTSVCLQKTSPGDAARWVKRFTSQVPTLTYTPPAVRGGLLPITLSRLINGGKLRIVLLGDSIANDTGNSLFETALHERYPHTRFEVINSVRGSTGSQWYQHENRVQDYVLRFNPDLLIIAGISHAYDVEAMRSVIRQIRAKSSPDILVLSDAIGPQAVLLERHARATGLSQDDVKQIMQRFPRELRAMTGEEKVELLDMRTAWDEYLRTSPQQPDWYMRDYIHANSRGKQVVGHILARYLELTP